MCAVGYLRAALSPALVTKTSVAAGSVGRAVLDGPFTLTVVSSGVHLGRPGQAQVQLQCSLPSRTPEARPFASACLR